MFKGEKIIIPCELRKNMIGHIHSTYTPIKNRERDLLFWPRIGK